MNIVNSFSLCKFAQLFTLGILSLTMMKNSSANQLNPLESYWSKQRGDNVTCGTEKCHQAVLNTGGYRYVRIEGYIYKQQRKGTVPLKLYWYPKRSDNATVASRKSIADQEKTKGMSFIRTEGYVYPASNCK